MRANIKPLDGKYYGTEIEIDADDGDTALVKVWVASFDPSDRYLEKFGYTRKQWDSNELVDDGWGGKQPIQEIDLICDSHHECLKSYAIAEAITRAINEL